ncbi:hypothetical protein ALC56_13487 [Trachymyrmex septentrionalis]|uniref:Uncharacterized protein n=1 Tax=Trachymyrmex septentrionalis TaxID=34720 RepID=A0A195EW42_9HYME|nr:hypothetical protein ALC56_13487 [Trachymyrmex septentrionalis]
MARKTGGLSASKQHRYNVPTCFHTPFITLFIREQVSFVTAARALQAWREWDGLTLMRLVAPLLRIDQKDRLRLPDLLWWTFLYEPSETSGIREGDGTDKANSGYFAPRRDTLKRRPCLGRDKPLATAAPIEGVKGGGGGWTSVWVSGEQGRAAACCPHQAPLRIFHREFTSLDTTGKLQEWRSNLSLLASVGSLFFSQVPFPERPSSRTHIGLHKSYKIVKTIAFQPSYCAIIMRKIVTTIHSTCFIAVFHPHLSPHRGERRTLVLNATYGEEKYQVKKTGFKLQEEAQGGRYIAAVVINQCCPWGLCKDERTKGEKGCVISRMMVEVSMKEGGRLSLVGTGRESKWQVGRGHSAGTLGVAKPRKGANRGPRVETRQKGVSSVKEGGSLRCRAVRRGMEDPGAGKNARGQEASDDIATPEAP